MSSHSLLRAWLSRGRNEAADHQGVVPPSGTLALGGGDDSCWADIGSKAAMLHRAAKAGLGVPPGFVVPEPDSVAGSTTPAAVDGASVRAWAQRVATDSPIGTVAVRSAFGAEDTEAASMAGWFKTLLDVDLDAVDDAVVTVRSSAVRPEDSSRSIEAQTTASPRAFRRDVLVMAMVEAERAGVAFSEPGTYDDLVNVATGTADRLVSGEEAGERLLLPRLEAAEGPPWQGRLQALLGRLREHFGDRPWDVEWADDGKRCWLIQIRPITAASRRSEVLTIANHAEILPAVPSPLMTSVIAEAGPELFDWYRRFDRSLPADRHFLVVVAGRPFINLSLLEDLMRHLGLPTGLVAGALGGATSTEPRPVNPRRLLGRAHVLARLGLAMVSAVVRAETRAEQAASFGRRRDGTFTTALEELRSAHVALVTGMFPLSSAIGPPLAVLRSTGTLAAHARDHRTITTEMAEALAATDPDDPAHVAAFLERFGHRGVYESDVARPRYTEDPSLVIAAAGTGAGPKPDEGPGLSFTQRAALVATKPLWAATARPMAAREQLRHEAMRSFATIRTHLVAAAERTVEEGRLRSVEDLWLLRADEARQLDRGWVPGDQFWAEREAEIEAHRRLDPPATGRSDDDPADWAAGAAADAGAAASRFRGIGLTRGTVRGTAWVLAEPSTEMPEGFVAGETVLVARSIDAGWIPTMASVAAVVAEIGGDLSHGSILIRERGVPAVTNVAGVTRHVATGDLIEVRADSGTVEVLERG